MYSKWELCDLGDLINRFSLALWSVSENMATNGLHAYTYYFDPLIT